MATPARTAIASRPAVTPIQSPRRLVGGFGAPTNGSAGGATGAPAPTNEPADPDKPPKPPLEPPAPDELRPPPPETGLAAAAAPAPLDGMPEPGVKGSVGGSSGPSSCGTVSSGSRGKP